MSTYDELIKTITSVRDSTGDPNAWQAGLAPDEVAAVVTPTTRPEQLDAIVRKIRQRYAPLFGAAPAGAPEPGRGQGEAAEAMADAEAALAHQNSASSQLDMQVITAILNAHLKAVEGSEALTRLQRETETAVLTRSDLDTPAGARDFQRFLIGKLKDIRAVVLNASLDDTSKSALMAAWTSLYDASKDGPAERPPEAAVPVAASGDRTTQSPVDDPALEPLPDSMWADDSGAPAGDLPGSAPAASAPAMPTAPALPAVPSIPGFGGAPIPGLGGSGGLPLPGLQDLARESSFGPHDQQPGDGPEEPVGDDDNAHAEDVTDHSEPPPAGPTVVTLPDGDTVTAASPQLAAAIQAAIGGASIPDAFHQQGITIPPPGTAVTNPIDPLQAAPGDIGILTDRHALALGHEKALLDGQIQRIATVSGPNFLGWEHPPAAAAPANPPADPHPPTPTGPAATSTA
ncbi:MULTISPECIES: DUF4226 domain-containing protein [unclassified Mycobacterium]|uniref:DUF4226 domain-containing protein n=1 Tax=unclassified Mycobacterium TaxID=2642494 RepID=UPI0007FBF471|nr:MULTISPECIES: DUF4226 domain-containing protein [unclassified Mycobacterium]OBH04506.1 hypothetical protein A5696_04840 [Mycobacterium sp. E2699]OBI49905.1 hypothetical protein A5705_00495 [Mycobacterium sp. E787]